MTRPARRRSMVAALVAVLLAFLAPSLPVAAQAGPLPRIAVDVTGFTDTATGKPWTARGVNHLRLSDDGTGSDTWYLSTFEPGLYDPVASRAVLAKRKARGDNTFRVFIDEGLSLDAPGAPHGIGRGRDDTRPYDPAYLDNVADFVRAAIDARIYVIPIVYRLPYNCFYFTIVQDGQSCSTVPRTAGVQGRNAYYLDTGYIAAKREYLSQFSSGLLTRIGAANATAILAYEAENEAVWQTDRGPWSADTGTLTPADGGTYDLAVPADRQQAADASLVQYTHQVKAGQLTGDPSGYLTMGFYGYQAVGKTGPDGFGVHCGGTAACTPGVDYREPLRPLVASLHGRLDFVDFHFYPRRAPYSVAADLASGEMDRVTRVPWIVGEIGAFRDVYNGSATLAGDGIRTARAQACTVGTGYRGILFWTADNQDNADQRRLFTLRDKALDDAMSPIKRPNPCVR